MKEKGGDTHTFSVAFSGRMRIPGGGGGRGALGVCARRNKTPGSRPTFSASALERRMLRGEKYTKRTPARRALSASDAAPGRGGTLLATMPRKTCARDGMARHTHTRRGREGTVPLVNTHSQEHVPKNAPWSSRGGAASNLLVK